jgi:hypothetical protein
MRYRLAAKPAILLWLMIFLGFSGTYLRNIHSQRLIIDKGARKSYWGTIEVPRLRRYENMSTPIADRSLWNLQAPEKEQQTVSAKPASPYGLRSFGDVQALYNLKNSQERWEFYGIFQINGKTRAIFHNPSLAPKGWFVPCVAEEFSPGLRLAEISESQVVLVETQGEVGKTWQLTLFAQVTPVTGPDPAHVGWAERR